MGRGVWLPRLMRHDDSWRDDDEVHEIGRENPSIFLTWCAQETGVCLDTEFRYSAGI